MDSLAPIILAGGIGFAVGLIVGLIAGWRSRRPLIDRRCLGGVDPADCDAITIYDETVLDMRPQLAVRQ